MESNPELFYMKGSTLYLTIYYYSVERSTLFGCFVRSLSLTLPLHVECLPNTSITQLTGLYSDHYEGQSY